MDFKNKVVIVTGASSGIGASVAIAFSLAGAKVVMVGRNENELKRVAAQCKNLLVLIADMTQDGDVKRVMDETIEKFGQLDILINNAGLASAGNIMDADDMMKSFDLVMNTNVRSLVHMTSLAAPHLAKTKGNIVNIYSVDALITPIFNGTINYYVSKAAVNHFGACAAAELAPHGITVNTVSPGRVKTDFITNATATDYEVIKIKNALKWISEPEEIAVLVLFLASEIAKGMPAIFE